jgi:drug/metabolite transporter (DMT)-like permease
MLLGVGVAALIGQLFLTKAFAAGEAASVSVVGLSQVVFAVVFDVLVFRDRFTAAALAGMGLVVAPTAWLMLSRKG